MTNREFENYLALVSRLLRLKRKQTDQIAVELRDHLEMRVAELTETGVEPEEATRQALAEFGDAASLANQFQFVSKSYNRRWMMRFATLSVAGLFLVAVFAMAMWPEKARFGSPDSVIADNGSLFATKSIDEKTMSEVSKLNATTREQLRKPLDIDFEEVQLLDVMERISEQLEINVVLDHSAREEGLAEDQSITIRVKGIPANQVLKLMLGEHGATYVVDSGVLRIISSNVANDSNYFSRRIMDVSEVLALINKLESHRIGTFHHPQVRRRLGGGGGIFCIQTTQQDNKESGRSPGSPSVAVDSSSADSSTEQIGGTTPYDSGVEVGFYTETVTAENLLEDLIKSVVASESWNDMGGDGTVQIMGGLLITVQSESVNNEIEQLLQDLGYQLGQREKSM